MITRHNLYVGFSVHCDICKETLVIESSIIDDVTIKNATETARMYGWSIGKQNLCPACKQKERNLNKP